MDNTENGRSPLRGSGCQPAASAAEEASSLSGIPNALAGADDWEVGPCVDRLGHVTCWDISLPREPRARGVAVIASVYSGEETARAILAAIHTAAVEARRDALRRMVQSDEELGLYDDEPVPPASGIETEGHDGETRHGAKHESPTGEAGGRPREVQ